MREENCVSIWLGYFESEALFNEYFDESYDEESEDVIDSKHQSFFNLDYYDTDFCERSYHSNLSSLQSIFTGHSYMEEITKELSNEISVYNCIYFIYDFKSDKVFESYKNGNNMMDFYKVLEYQK